MTKNQLSSSITLQDIGDLLDKKLDVRFKAFEQELDKKIGQQFQEMKAYFDKKIGSLEKSLRAEIRTLKGEIKELRDEVKLLKDEVSVIKGEIELIKADIKVLKDEVSVIKGEIELIKTEIRTIKGDIASLNLRITRFERKFEERSSFWESFENGVDSFMGEIIESRKDRTRTDEKLKGHEKRLCVLEYAVLHEPKNKTKYGD